MMSSSFVMAHNPLSVTEICENANAPMKRELLVVRRVFALGSTSRVKPHESSRFEGSHQPEPQLQEVSNRCRNAVESSQILTSFIVIIIITACARPLLAIATTGQAL
jgi:hypothetical protein